MTGTVGRSDGGVEDGGVVMASARRSRMWTCAACTSWSIVGVPAAECIDDCTALVCDDSGWKVWDEKVDVAISNDFIQGRQLGPASPLDKSSACNKADWNTLLAGK
jgi:hypothetical protein